MPPKKTHKQLNIGVFINKTQVKGNI